MIPPVILASQSPRRRELLEKTGIPFSIIVRDTEELKEASMPPQELCLHNASAKAEAVFREHRILPSSAGIRSFFWKASLLASRKMKKKPGPYSGSSPDARTMSARRLPSVPRWA